MVWGCTDGAPFVSVGTLVCICYTWYGFCGVWIGSQQSHLRSARVLRVGFPFGLVAGPGIPPMRAQNEVLRAADLGDLAACLAETGGFRVPPVCAL